VLAENRGFADEGGYQAQT